MSKCRVSTGGLSMGVFLQGFAQRRAACPSSQGSPGSLLSDPQNGIAAGIQGGKGKQRAHGGWMLSPPCQQAGNQGWNLVLLHFCEAQCLHSHPPALLRLPCLKPVQLQLGPKERKALLQLLAIYLPPENTSWKILFAMLNKAVA